jgi:hypothetical protein
MKGWVQDLDVEGLVILLLLAFKRSCLGHPFSPLRLHHVVQSFEGSHGQGE